MCNSLGGPASSAAQCRVVNNIAYGSFHLTVTTNRDGGTNTSSGEGKFFRLPALSYLPPIFRCDKE